MSYPLVLILVLEFDLMFLISKLLVSALVLRVLGTQISQLLPMNGCIGSFISIPNFIFFH